MPKQKRKSERPADKKRQKTSREKPLSLAPLTPEEAIKRVLGGASKETRPESMVPRGKPKSPKK